MQSDDAFQVPAAVCWSEPDEATEEVSLDSRHDVTTPPKSVAFEQQRTAVLCCSAMYGGEGFYHHQILLGNIIGAQEG